MVTVKAHHRALLEVKQAAPAGVLFAGNRAVMHDLVSEEAKVSEEIRHDLTGFDPKALG